MSEVHWYSDAQPLNVATGEQAGSRKACGKVHIVDVDGNMTVLTDVEYVPTALENLLSMSAAVESGFRFPGNLAGETVKLRHTAT
jgi:hypothetical protein